MSSLVKLGLVPMSCVEEQAANFAKAAARIEAAARLGAQIICLQELFSSRYFCQQEDHRFFRIAEAIPGPTTERLGQIAQQHQIVLIVSVFEKRGEGVYHNTAAVIDADGSLLGIYRKMHIPDDPLYYEKFYFAPGDTGFKCFKTRYGKIGVLICWDQWFPEAARLTALAGAQIIFYPTAIGWLAGEDHKVNRVQVQAWQNIQISHAIANGVYVASVNRVGCEGKLTFWGSSFVSSPFGEVLAQAGETDEENLIVTCDLQRIDEVRQHWPFLRDRRIDAYQDITHRLID